MSNQTTQGTTVMVQGRIVWANNTNGDIFKGRMKLDKFTKQPVINPKTGSPVIEYGFGLAVPKPGPTASPEAVKNFTDVWNALHAEAYKLYPSGQVPPAFAWKKKDGDTDIDEKGVPYSQRIGHAGHMILACTTTLPIKYFKTEQVGPGLVQHFQIAEGVKSGDYVNVQLVIKNHPALNGGKPGLYLNPQAVQFLGFGEAIINAPSADQIFGNVAPVMPMGASATPMATPGFIVPPAQPTAPQMHQGTPFQQTQPMAPPVQAPAAPHYGVLPQVHQPQAAPQVPQYQQPMAPPTQPVAPQMPMPQVPQYPGYQPQ